MKSKSPWDGDLLGFQEIGVSFGNLVKSINDSRVISIEAGFGRGKTFFRTAWAEYLRQEGEVVVEIDAQLSDHSGDPVVTFIGALAAHLPPQSATSTQKAMATVTKYGALATRGLARAVLRSAADELIDAVQEKAMDAVEGSEALEGVVKEVGGGMSTVASTLIATQLAAEQVRVKELPEQLSVLRDALSKGKDTKRVVILIDELDRCHPDYAIALLEAMKLVFDHEGFVFCLMVNADYLENLAAHRFGVAAKGEKYLDKFVDLRLKLPETAAAKGAAARALALGNLIVEIPFGEGNEFSLEAAADLAERIAREKDLTMRQIKRVLLKVELALRCYSDRPLDAPLLVFMAFSDAHRAIEGGSPLPERFLPRSGLTHERGLKMKTDDPFGRLKGEAADVDAGLQKSCGELYKLPRERYRLPDDKDYFDWAKVGAFLSEFYLREHRDILDSVHQFGIE